MVIERRVVDERMLVAGDAACLLEEHGFTAVARKREDRVTLEFWRVIDGEQIGMTREIPDATERPEDLVELCLAAFQASQTVH